MPLILQVLTYRDQPLAGRSCVFAADTGTLGRAENNDLVLEDPGKYISRVHARIERRGESFCFTNIGSNPSVVNERLLGYGQETSLEEGDSIVIGEYRLEVRMQVETSVDEKIEIDDDSASQTQSQNLTLAVFDRAAAPPIWTAPGAPAIEAVSASPPSSSVPSLSSHLPDALAAALILENGSLSPVDLPLADPLGLNLFAQAHEARMPGLDSPREDRWQPAFRGAQHDHLSPELQALPPSVITPVQATPQTAPLLIPADYDPLADLIATPMPVAMREPAPTPDNEVHATPPEISTEAIFVAAPIPAPEPAACADDVLQALLEGLGLPDLRTQREPRDLARLVGEMLREAVGGTMDILLARAMTKRDSHIDMTMIGARSNNPLKFFPNPESALSQMLSADAPAYLPGVSALAAAFDDLKAHELSVIVGMRAALAEVVQRFEPARIEQRLAVPGRFDKLMPGARKARLWDLLTALYADLVRDGDEDVQRIFGEKFALAYQQQIARLRAAR
jgi:type VI secretion system FHA domain protein